MTNNFPYIVIDTNVLISAGLLPTSKTAQVLEIAVAHFVIAQNQATWHELETRIQRSKFDRYFTDDGRLRHLIRIAQSMQVFQASAKVQASTDVTDDKFIELAIDSGAKIVISGDQDLKEITRYGDVEILSPALFYERFCER